MAPESRTRVRRSLNDKGPEVSFGALAESLPAVALPATRGRRSELAFHRRVGGGNRDRTGDLMNAIHALSQLSYTPRGLSVPGYPVAKCGRVIATLTRVIKFRMEPRVAFFGAPHDHRPRRGPSDCATVSVFATSSR